MNGLTRREFMVTLGAAGLGAAASSWYAERLFAMVREGSLPVPRGPGIERWVPTACRLCPAACGMRVRLVDGLPVGLEGDRAHPVSAGGLCPAGFSGLQELVHPDRLRAPVRRAGARGSGQWREITWDEAFAEIAGRLQRLRAEGRPQAFAVLEPGDSPLTTGWLERVLRAYGSPNLILGGSHEPWRAAWTYMAGAEAVPAVDLAHSDFILSFGHELFETDGHPVWQSKVWGQLRGPSVQQPGVLAYVGSRVSPTAARADLRLMSRPGQEATLALGLLHVLLVEDLVDRTFLERWTDGFSERGRDAHEGFESFVRRNYSPEDVSRLTSAPIGDILRLGRALGNAQRPVALLGSSALHREGALAAAAAVVALNLALGAVGRPGGYVAAGRPPVRVPEPPEPDAIARKGLAQPRVDGAGSATLSAIRQSPSSLSARLESGEPYPLEVLLIHGVNPVHEWPGGGAVERALARVPLLVATAVVPDETAAAADIVLPESSFLESWNLLPSMHALPLELVGIQQPAVAPLHSSRPFEDIWFELARRVGGPAAAAVPAGSYAEWLPTAAEGLFHAGRGTIASGAAGERIAGFIEARGWRAGGPPDEPAFWKALCESAGWVNSSEVGRSPAELLGPGEKAFRFWPERYDRDARQVLGGAAPEAGIYAVPDDGAAAAPAERAAGLELLLFDTNTLWGGRTALTPLMLELTGAREDIAWDSWVEIHPATADALGIHVGDRVRLEAAGTSAVTRARIVSTVPTDTVAMPRGLGHRHFGRFANGVGAHAAGLLSSRPAPGTGSAVLAGRVHLTRA